MTISALPANIFRTRGLNTRLYNEPGYSWITLEVTHKNVRGKEETDAVLAFHHLPPGSHNILAEAFDKINKLIAEAQAMEDAANV